MSLSTYYLEYGCHLARLCRHGRAYVPTSNTASHDDHEKIHWWVSLDFHLCDAYGALLGGPLPELRYKNPQLVAQHCFVASFGRCFPFFTLRDQLVVQQKHFLRVEESWFEKQSPGLLWSTNFGFVACFSSNSQIVAQQICLCPSQLTNQRAAFLQLLAPCRMPVVHFWR